MKLIWFLPCFLLFLVTRFNCISGSFEAPRDVSDHPSELPAHPSCDEHERRRQEERHVRPHRHQGYRSTIRQPRSQEGNNLLRNCSVLLTSKTVVRGYVPIQCITSKARTIITSHL